MPPRVLSLSHGQNGCMLYRTWMPLAALAARGWDAGWIEADRFRPAHLAGVDVLVLPRLGCAPDAALRLVTDARAAGCKLVFECDDDLWDTDPDNPSHAELTAGAEDLRGVLRVCDAATATNAVLAARLQAEAGWDLPVWVLPNAVDKRIWEGVERARTDPRLTVGVHGGGSHARDWAPLGLAWRAVAEAHPEVRFVCAGYTPPAFAGIPNLVSLPFVPLARYPASVAQLDVACCPLEDTPFNRAKSPIKWMESSMAGAAGVVSEAVYGPLVRAVGGKDAQAALVVPPGADRDPGAWAERILTLLEDAPRRRRMAARAKSGLLQGWEIGTRWRHWADAYAAIAGMTP